VVERKNKSLEELARTMLNETSLPKYFLANGVNTASYVLNRVLTMFGCKCFILTNGKEQFGKFDSKANEGIFLGYAINSHAYRVYKKILMIVEESVHVVFDETNPVQQDQD